MLNLKIFSRLVEALSQCSVRICAGDLLIIDRNSEAVWEVNFESSCRTVYRGYRPRIVTRRLKRAAIPLELQDQRIMEQVTRILYEQA